MGISAGSLRAGHTLVPWCFVFFSYGKYIAVAWALFRVATKALSERQSRQTTCSLLFFIAAVLLFATYAVVGWVGGNDPAHILRNNFLSTIFILVGLVLFWGNGDIPDVRESLTRVINSFKPPALVFLMCYVAGVVFPDLRVYFNDIVHETVGFNFRFSSRPAEYAIFPKIFSGLLVIYLFFIPAAYSLRGQTGRSWVYFASLVALTGSLTQYAIIAVYGAVWVVRRCLASPCKSAAMVIPSAVFASVIVVAMWDVGLVHHVRQKVMWIAESGESVFENGVKDWRDVSEVNSVTRRVIQARILVKEISEAPLLGHGLGYQSDRYNEVRSSWTDVQEFQKSMYELQYLDIPMKFGIPGAILLAALFWVIPIGLMVGRGAYRERKLAHCLLLGYFGVVIYAGSNGNYFYSYGTMLCWGMIVAIGLRIQQERVMARRGECLP